ncbi:MAG: hydroxymethylbilane synthase [Rhodospirillaceae bacterium]|nr:hydroxymethylbilane synthase [Rhodospirillaceae bacterium]
MSPLKIGSRASPLALRQAEEVRNALVANQPDLQVDIIEISTTGDRIQDRTLAAIGGKGLFTKEIEQALLDGAVDICVHSAKDMLTEFPSGLMLGPILQREDTRDGFISHSGQKLSEMPSGAVIGTASLRRQSQILALRPDLEVITFRGTVQTRLRKLDEGQADATLLAVAGLKRLDCMDVLTQIFDPETILPAVGQGAIALELRVDDERSMRAVEPLNDVKSATEVAMERAFLAVLDGSCRTPIAGIANANIDADRIKFRGLIAKADGSVVHSTIREGTINDAIDMGKDAGLELKTEAGPNFLP